ncbi:MAG: polysaccharide biosynthesis/export family protein [Muribaculaceae bacterium]|nr:polysaccharide biosynthesis/export family protein [Muribaculaceae bacterium]
MNLKKFLKSIFIAAGLLVMAGACSTPKNIAYFQDAQNAEIIQIMTSQNREIKVEPHDKLSIVIKSKDPALAQIFNLNVISNYTSHNTAYNGTGADVREYSLSTNEGISTYTVTPQGTIDFPVLGVLKVEGMTRSELAAYIKGEIVGRGLVKDPVVIVEFINTGVSILGEVAHPGRYDMNKDVLTLIEALSLAGDMTIQGKRENVMVLRQTGDTVQTFSIDLTDAKNLASSPAFYLKQGDVIYVEPNNFRKRQTTNNANNVMNASFWLSVASLVATVAVLFVK